MTTYIRGQRFVFTDSNTSDTQIILKAGNNETLNIEGILSGQYDTKMEVSTVISITTITGSVLTVPGFYVDTTANGAGFGTNVKLTDQFAAISSPYYDGSTFTYSSKNVQIYKKTNNNWNHLQTIDPLSVSCPSNVNFIYPFDIWKTTSGDYYYFACSGSEDNTGTRLFKNTGGTSTFTLLYNLGQILFTIGYSRCYSYELNTVMLVDRLVSVCSTSGTFNTVSLGTVSTVYSDCTIDNTNVYAANKLNNKIDVFAKTALTVLVSTIPGPITDSVEFLVKSENYLAFGRNLNFYIYNISTSEYVYSETLDDNIVDISIERTIDYSNNRILVKTADYFLLYKKYGTQWIKQDFSYDISVLTTSNISICDSSILIGLPESGPLYLSNNEGSAIILTNNQNTQDIQVLSNIRVENDGIFMNSLNPVKIESNLVYPRYSLIVDGAAYFNDLRGNIKSDGNITVNGNVTATDITASGNITATDITASGSITGSNLFNYYSIRGTGGTLVVGSGGNIALIGGTLWTTTNNFFNGTAISYNNNGRFTINETGLYAISGLMNFNINLIGYFGFSLNGGTMYFGNQGANVGLANVIGISALLRLTNTQYVEMMIYSPGAITITSKAESGYFNIAKIA